MGSEQETMPNDAMVNIPHVTQKSNWDCGLACSLMILSFFKRDTAGFNNICKKLNFGESVWTIDLAHIMKYYNIKHLLCTITLGVDKSYSKENFYKSRFTSDELRVNKLFAERDTLGLSAEQRSVSLLDILQHVGKGQVAIVLIDWSVLCRRICTDTKCLPSVSCVGKCKSLYQGHFVIVCGYNKQTKVIYFQNPAISSPAVSSTSIRSFDAARRSYGTDEDILFIYSD